MLVGGACGAGGDTQSSLAEGQGAGGAGARGAHERRLKEKQSSVQPQGHAREEPSSAQLGPAKHTTRFPKFVKRWKGGGVLFDEVPLHLPAVAYDTVATWLRVPDTARAAVPPPVLLTNPSLPPPLSLPCTSPTRRTHSSQLLPQFSPTFS
jgi:hypothetical protein